MKNEKTFLLFYVFLLILRLIKNIDRIVELFACSVELYFIGLMGFEIVITEKSRS